MPLPADVEREELHHRDISMRVYRRKDGLFSVEAHLVDTKPFVFEGFRRPRPLPAGEPLHDLWLRLVIDADYAVHAVHASLDEAPFPTCPRAADALQALVGARIGKGWAKLVRERLARADNCAHLSEMLLPMATVALMGIGLARPMAERFPPGVRPALLDSCYSWSTSRELVRANWPEFSTHPDAGE